MKYIQLKTYLFSFFCCRFVSTTCHLFSTACCQHCEASFSFSRRTVVVSFWQCKGSMFIVFLKEFARKFFEKSLINDVNQGCVCEHNMFYGIFNGFSRFITFLLSFVVFVSCFSFPSHLIETCKIILFLFSVASFSKNRYICIILCRNCFTEAIEASLRVPIFPTLL